MLDLAVDEFNDLTLDEGTNDFKTELVPKNAIVLRIIEMFDMQVADDIDYPTIFSDQRRFINSDKVEDELERVNQAKKLLESVNEVDKDSIDISIVNDKLTADFSILGEYLRVDF